MTIALTIFALTYLLIATEKFPRQAVALLGGTLMIMFGVFDIKEALGFVDWETMGLLFGMFILVAILAEAGFFTWLAIEIAAKLQYRPSLIFIFFPLLAAFMAAFMDSITVMLFLSALTLRISRLTKLDPVPLIIAEVCAANTGGAATLVGDPPNVILGTTLGFGFNDFLIHNGPVVFFAVLVIVGAFYLTNRQMIRTAEAQINLAELVEIDRAGLITNTKMVQIGGIGFAVAILLLVTHQQLSDWLHIDISAAVAALMPALLVVSFGGKDLKHIINKIDIDSLFFFIGLFVMVGALEHTHFMEILAKWLLQTAGSNPNLLLMSLHWLIGMLSGVVDNVPLALAMSYVMKEMAAMPGAPALSIMVWALSLGLDIGGNLTPVGASPNLVAYTFLERSHIHVGWKRWIKLAAAPTFLAMIVCSFFLLLKYAIGFY